MIKKKSHLGASIVLTGRLLINNVNSHLIATGTNITFEQLEVLMHISGNPEKKIIQNDLANLMKKNKSGVLRTIDVLEKKNFVKRTSMPGDRRKNVIEVTREGNKTTKRALETLEKVELDYLGKINTKDILICNKVLESIKKTFTPFDLKAEDL